MIEFENVTLARSNTVFFRELNLHLAPGEHWVITGPNGGGKTILMNALAGILRPRHGKIRFNFIKSPDLDDWYRQRRELIHVVPAEWLHSILGTGGHFYQERYYSMSQTRGPLVRDFLGDDRRALTEMNFPASFQIDRLLDLEIARLSNGQLRKVIILGQLSQRIPRLLLLDYPYEGLDAESRRELNAFLDHLASHFGIQLIVVAQGHDVPQVMNKTLVVDEFQIVVHEGVVSAEEAIATTPITTHHSKPQEEPVVEMRNVTLSYGGHTIISNFNWRINRGDRWALTGRNGSGKTTLFSLIYADHPMAYSQQVFLFGKRRGTGESIWDIKKRINYLGPEQIHFLNTKSASLSGRNLIVSQPHTDASQLDALVDFFNATSYIDKPLMRLSSGQLQMIMLMNTFLDRKELLLLDEPFQYLDEQNHARVTAFLNQYLNSDTTLVLITHDERDVSQWTQQRMRL